MLNRIHDQINVQREQDEVTITLDFPGEDTSTVEILHYISKEKFTVKGGNRDRRFSIPEQSIFERLGIFDPNGMSLTGDDYEVLNGVLKLTLKITEEEPIKLQPKDLNK